MKTKLLIGALCGAMAVAGTVSVSQAAPAPDAARIRAVLADFGTCVVKREPDAARAQILSGEFLEPRSDAGGKLIQGECLAESKMRLGMDSSTFKGAIAQALFDRDAASLTATSFAAVPPLTYAEPWPVKTVDRRGESLREDQIARQQKAFDRKQGENARLRLGECVVRADGPGARAVLTTPIDTPAELEALKAVSPAISACLPKGETIAFDRMTLRGALATGYYRLATAAQASGAAN